MLDITIIFDKQEPGQAEKDVCPESVKSLYTYIETGAVTSQLTG